MVFPLADGQIKLKKKKPSLHNSVGSFASDKIQLLQSNSAVRWVCVRERERERERERKCVCERGI